jgi:hypothetical protein
MDELKKYIQQNTDRLNVEEPGPEVWLGVKEGVKVVKEVKMVKEVGGSHTIGLFTKWALAACVILLAGIGIWYAVSDRKTVEQTATANVHEEKKVSSAIVTPEKTETEPTEKPEPVIIAKNNRTPKTNKPINQQPSLNSMELGELYELENSFSQVINLQRANISTIPMYAETPEYFKDFKLQLKQIDKDEKGIKSDITHNGMNSELLDQLINLYQQKLSLLKQMQLEMNKTNNRYKQNRAQVDSTKSYFIKL